MQKIAFARGASYHSGDVVDQPRSFAELARVYLRRGKHRPKTRRDYERYLNRFDDFIGHGDVSGLTLDKAIRWRHELDTASGPYVAKLGTSVLKAFASWLASEKHLRDEHGRSVLLGLGTPRTPATKRKPFTDEQLDAIWTALNERTKQKLQGIAYARLVYGAALRRSTVGTILLRNVDTATRWLQVTVVLTRGSRSEVKRIRLDRVTVTAVSNYLASSERPRFRGKPPEPLFVSDKGLTYVQEGFNAFVSRLGADIERLTAIPWTSDQMWATGEAHLASQIRDPILRRRCQGLLAAESDHDQAITAATIVLEDRVRLRSGAPQALVGDDLMKFAFDGAPPRLDLAQHPTERWGAWNIYRGVAAFYRNGTAHRIRPQDFDPNEARRVVSLIDHLLGLID